MAKTQWHPMFASLLKALLRDYYTIDPEVSVSELPRRGDLLVVRKQDGPAPPFTGLWSWLRDWNVIEFKGMTDDANAADLELLVHVGTGLTYKTNEERRGRREEPLANMQMTFWYVAGTIGQTFLRNATSYSEFIYQTSGVWRGTAWGHPMFLVSAEGVPPEELDSLPLGSVDNQRRANG
jgi:hypothetical protein